MRITITGINYYPEVTGIAPYTTGLAQGLAERGHQVQVITGLPHYPEWRIADAYRSWRRRSEHINGVTVDRVRHHVPARLTPRGRVVLEASFAQAVLRSSWRRPDLVITVSPSLLASAAVIAEARLRRVPVGIIVQDLYSSGVVETGAMGGRTAGAAARFEAGVLRAATGVSVIHERFVDVITRLGLDRDKIAVNRNWTHITAPTGLAVDEVRRRYGWRPDETIVVHSGNMGAKQGLENVVAAGKLAHDTAGAPGDVRFVLIGDGNQRRALERQGDGVPTVDFVDPLPADEFTRVLQAADVLLVNEKPGVGEMAVPSKLTSYFSSGRPVLAATDASSGAAHEIRNSGGGVLVPPGDPAALLDAVRAIVGDEDAARAMGASGQEYARSTLDTATAIDHYEKWCYSLRDQGPGAA
ncbi:WcaI family glycosyltransferase [Mycobacterium sp. MYCO198283]|uniref:WcaI family glycosyltransferase n=1 Tax=Mycobacterium sp. MYCO198283 TaxID=2883505 RepID=UPI001E376314|nr:WcaI family glycosyltransferase [Mycobacterium sp. MYCO198283]MCG5431650.1 WcaI family glycosyltransferase [Mycobacterium sp. MYCO198283]